jgi:hypothetical protein
VKKKSHLNKQHHAYSSLMGEFSVHCKWESQEVFCWQSTKSEFRTQLSGSTSICNKLQMNQEQCKYLLYTLKCSNATFLKSDWSGWQHSSNILHWQYILSNNNMLQTRSEC